MLLPEWNYVELLIGLGPVQQILCTAFAEITVKPQLLQRLLLRRPLQLLHHHVLVLIRVQGKLIVALLHLLPNRSNHRLLEKHFGGLWVLMLDGFGYLIITQPHGPGEVVLSDIALAQQMPELSDVALHETLGPLLALLHLRTGHLRTLHQ